MLTLNRDKVDNRTQSCAKMRGKVKLWTVEWSKCLPVEKNYFFFMQHQLKHTEGQLRAPNLTALLLTVNPSSRACNVSY